MTDIHLPYVDELRDNFLRYVAVSSESDPKAGRVPSSGGPARDSRSFSPANLRRSGSSRSN
ncbi:MAG: hypothetical protein ACLUNV_05935 [Sutterella wadsworthensis]